MKQLQSTTPWAGFEKHPAKTDQRGKKTNATNANLPHGWTAPPQSGIGASTHAHLSVPFLFALPSWRAWPLPLKNNMKGLRMESSFSIAEAARPGRLLGTNFVTRQLQWRSIELGFGVSAQDKVQGAEVRRFSRRTRRS